jgi:hypothetical protein
VRIALTLALSVLLLAGCEPTCKATCKKLLDCEDVDTPRLSLEECSSSCQQEETLYESWDDQGKRDAIGEMKQCIADEACSAIADGACYDADLVIW